MPGADGATARRRRGRGTSPLDGTLQRRQEGADEMLHRLASPCGCGREQRRRGRIKPLSDA
jgi:hypothetical protein